MENEKFSELLVKFKQVATDEKVKLYTQTEGLTQEQYRALLLVYPRNELDKLEAALA